MFSVVKNDNIHYFTIGLSYLSDWLQLKWEKVLLKKILAHFATHFEFDATEKQEDVFGIMKTIPKDSW